MTEPLPETAEEIAPIAAGVVDVVLRIDRVPSFAGNRVFRVAGAEGVRFFKFGPLDDLAREEAALRAAAGAGVPVPRVHAVDLGGRWSPHPLLVLDEVAGRPGQGTEPAFGSTIPALMARWHAVAIQGFGTTSVRDARLVGASPSWVDALRTRAAAAQSAVAAALVPKSLVEQVVGAVDEHRDVLDLEEASLLHGDFHPRHVYLTDDTVTSVIDWGDATAGDPDYDLARVLHAAVLREGIERGLEQAVSLLPLSERALDRRRLSKLLLYAAVFVCWSMAGEVAGGAPWPPWWPIQTRALTALLAAMDTTAD